MKIRMESIPETEFNTRNAVHRNDIELVNVKCP